MLEPDGMKDGNGSIAFGRLLIPTDLKTFDSDYDEAFLRSFAYQQCQLIITTRLYCFLGWETQLSVVVNCGSTHIGAGKVSSI